MPHTIRRNGARRWKVCVSVKGPGDEAERAATLRKLATLRFDTSLLVWHSVC